MKAAICILGLLYILSVHVPPAQLYAGTDLLPVGQGQVSGLGQGIGHCTWLSEWRQCTPYRLTWHYKTSASGVESVSINSKHNREYALVVRDHAGQIVWLQKGLIPVSSLVYPSEADASELMDKHKVRASLTKQAYLE